jgi:DNA-binding transcriptional MerR regulator
LGYVSLRTNTIHPNPKQGQMSLKEKQPEDLKLYYTIGEVSSMLGVNASLIRFWEKEFPALNLKKNKKGNRLFTKVDIQHLKEIYHWVKEQGYTLEGARKKMLAEKKMKSGNGRSGIESERWKTIQALLNELDSLLKR